MPLAVERLGTLDATAASGLVVADGRLWVVSDDGLELRGYAAEDLRPAGALRLLPGDLPIEAKARKAAKPDHEALAAWPGGGLVALGSGSTPRRHRGALVDLARGAVTAIDLAPLHAAIARALGEGVELNLEGAAVAGERLFLAQRGNGLGGVNALVELALAPLAADVAAGRPWRPEALVGVHRVTLPELGGVTLGLTDLAPPPAGAAADILYFSAAAEASPDAYQDGACAGSALGALDRAGGLVWCQPLETTDKIEGLGFAAGDRHATLVADADAHGRASPVFRTRAPLPRK